MRAAIFQKFGPPDVLEIRELERPTPLPTEVLVRVRAIGLNPVDAYIRSGAFPILKPPAILGWDISGVVEEVVPGVTRFKVGDEVFGMPLFPRAGHAYAEYVVSPSRQLAKKPARLDHAQAAALPLAGLTAWQALVEGANVGPGQRVLIHGGGGGVGHLAIQIAKARGAYVITTVSTAKRGFVSELGADQVIDYKTEDFSKAVRDVDVVLETVGGDYGTRSVNVLRPGGTLVTVTERTNAKLAAYTEQAGRKFVGIAVEPDYRDLEQLAALVDAGKLRVHVSERVPLDQVVRAHQLLDAHGITGKIVLTV